MDVEMGPRPTSDAPLPRDHVDNVCRMGQGVVCCQFLHMGPDGFGCFKGTSAEQEVRHRVAAGQFTAQGDNCPGPSRAGVL